MTLLNAIKILANSIGDWKAKVTDTADHTQTLDELRLAVIESGDTMTDYVVGEISICRPDARGNLKPIYMLE